MKMRITNVSFALPCPFCSCKEVLATCIRDHSTIALDVYIWRATCNNCSARGPEQPTSAKAVFMWNARLFNPSERT
jgi:Lar family restriction alleviation protein